MDGEGKAYVTGEFNTATFGSHVLTSSGEWDIFAAKLDSFGNWLWAVEAEGRSMTTDMASQWMEWVTLT